MFAHRRKPFRAIQAGVGERRRGKSSGRFRDLLEPVLVRGRGGGQRRGSCLCVYLIAGQEQLVEWWTATTRRRAILRCPRKFCSTRNDQKVAASARRQPTARVPFDCSSSGASELPTDGGASLGLLRAPTRCTRVLVGSPHRRLLIFISVSALSAPCHATRTLLIVPPSRIRLLGRRYRAAGDEAGDKPGSDSPVLSRTRAPLLASHNTAPASPRGSRFSTDSLHC